MPDAPRSDANRPRIVVCGWAGVGNLGDEMLTQWVVREIEMAGGTAIVASRSVADTRTRHPRAEVTRWGPRDLLTVLRLADGVCVGPGGIIQDRTSVWSLPGHLAKALAGRLRSLPVAGVGLGAEPLARRSSRWLLRTALAHPVAVVVRDEESARCLTLAGIEAEIGADVVFDLVGAGRTGSDGGGPCAFARVDGAIAVAIGPAVRGGRLRPAARRLDDGQVDLVTGALDALSARCGAPLALISFRGDRDAAFAARLADRLDAPTRMVGPDTREATAAIAEARVLVTSRYHAAVVGVAQGTPVIVRSDEQKLSSLVGQVGNESRLAALPTWSAVGEAVPGRAHGRGTTPGSSAPHREALVALVEAARNRRS